MSIGTGISQSWGYSVFVRTGVTWRSWVTEAGWSCLTKASELKIGVSGHNSLATCWCPKPGVLKYILVAELSILGAFLWRWMYWKYNGSLEVKYKGHVNKVLKILSKVAEIFSQLCSNGSLNSPKSLHQRWLHFYLKIENVLIFKLLKLHSFRYHTFI